MKRRRKLPKRFKLKYITLKSWIILSLCAVLFLCAALTAILYKNIQSIEAKGSEIAQTMEDSLRIKVIKEEPVRLTNQLLNFNFDIKSKWIKKDYFFAVDKKISKIVFLKRPTKLNRNLGQPEELYENYLYLDQNDDYVGKVIKAFRSVTSSEHIILLEKLILTQNNPKDKFYLESEYFLMLLDNALFVSDNASLSKVDRNKIQVVIYNSRITKICDYAFENVGKKIIPMIDSVEVSETSLYGAENCEFVFWGMVEKVSEIFFKNIYKVDINRFVLGIDVDNNQTLCYNEKNSLDLSKILLTVISFDGLNMSSFPLEKQMIDFSASDIDSDLKLKSTFPYPQSLSDAKANIVLNFANIRQKNDNVSKRFNIIVLLE